MGNVYECKFYGIIVNFFFISYHIYYSFLLLICDDEIHRHIAFPLLPFFPSPILRIRFVLLLIIFDLDFRHDLDSNWRGQTHSIRSLIGWESETMSFASRGHKSAEQKKTRYRPVSVPLHRSPTTTRETRYSHSRHTAKLASNLLRIGLGKFSVRSSQRVEWGNRLVKIYF